MRRWLGCAAPTLGGTIALVGGALERFGLLVVAGTAPLAVSSTAGVEGAAGRAEEADGVDATAAGASTGDTGDSDFARGASEGTFAGVTTTCVTPSRVSTRALTAVGGADTPSRVGAAIRADGDAMTVDPASADCVVADARLEVSIGVAFAAPMGAAEATPDAPVTVDWIGVALEGVALLGVSLLPAPRAAGPSGKLAAVAAVGVTAINPVTDAGVVATNAPLRPRPSPPLPTAIELSAPRSLAGDSTASASPIAGAAASPFASFAPASDPSPLDCDTTTIGRAVVRDESRLRKGAPAALGSTSVSPSGRSVASMASAGRSGASFGREPRVTLGQKPPLGISLMDCLRTAV
ncbi:MAG: hypothetical protein U0527_11195 [Candidatus Eisenbacteria bacterium]